MTRHLTVELAASLLLTLAILTWPRWLDAWTPVADRLDRAMHRWPTRTMQWLAAAFGRLHRR